MRRDIVTFSVQLPDGDPPKEFRIFRAGLNRTEKGDALFDDAAAKAVMLAYETHGADLMLDLEHLSLDSKAPNFDPDARGWATLELRDGELWAANVKWAPDGARRLEEKTQRYISPAFMLDRKTRRVTSLINVAITALPATHDLTPLIAARGEQTAMDPRILEALKLPPEATIEDVLAAIAAMTGDEAAEGDAPAASAESAPSPPASGAPVKKVTTEYHAHRAESAELAREVLSLRADLNKRDIEDLIKANRSKFTPALERWALTQSPDDLRTFLSAAPVIATAAPTREARTATAKVELDKADLEVCSATGTDPAKFLAHKTKLVARLAARNSADTAEEN